MPILGEHHLYMNFSLSVRLSVRPSFCLWTWYFDFPRRDVCRGMTFVCTFRYGVTPPFVKNEKNTKLFIIAFNGETIG